MLLKAGAKLRLFFEIQKKTDYFFLFHSKKVIKEGYFHHAIALNNLPDSYCRCTKVIYYLITWIREKNAVTSRQIYEERLFGKKITHII